MPFLTKVGTAIKNGAKKFAADKAKQKVAETAQDEEKRGNALALIGLGSAGCLLFPLIFIIVIFSYLFGTIQIADGAEITGSGGSSGLVYSIEELDKYYELSQNAPKSNNKPYEDLADTDYRTVDEFNEHIKTSVEEAGYGTREGVVVAGVALIGDYIAATGKRLRYDQYTSLGGRQDSDKEGIVNENFFLDCSSFAWWAVYNGGFKLPSYPQTLSQMNWARGEGILKNDVSSGKPGDFLVNSGHIILIIGERENGYYCAEFTGWGTGGEITIRNMSSLSSYQLIDMEKYYNDSSNVR